MDETETILKPETKTERRLITMLRTPGDHPGNGGEDLPRVLRLTDEERGGAKQETFRQGARYVLQ